MAKNNSAHDGTMVTIPIASLVSKPAATKSTYGLVQKEDEDETGYANESTVDATDYVTSAPQLVQLDKNDNLQGTLSLVDIQQTKKAKAAVEEEDSQESETGYGAFETVNVEDYVTGAPTSLIMLKKNDPSEGTVSVVQIKKMASTKQSHLGQLKEEKDDEAEEYKAAVNTADYANEAPALLQLESNWVGRSTLGPSTDPTDAPDWIKEVVATHSHEREYLEGHPEGIDMEYDPIMVKLAKTKHHHHQY